MMNAPARLAFKVGLATVLAVLAAFAFHLQDGYWVGISAFLICADRVGNSLEKMLQRIACTLIGAGCGVIVSHIWIENPFLLVMVSFCFVVLTVYQGFKNDAWYLWIFTTITFFMVVATTMTGAAPQAILDVAFYRSLDITVGSMIGFLVNLWVFPIHAGQELEAQLPVFLHDFEQYYSAAIEALFIPARRGGLPEWRQKIATRLAVLNTMSLAAARESIFWERQRRSLLEHVERVRLAIKQFKALEVHFDREDLSYLQPYQKEIFALQDTFKRFLREPLFHDAAVEEALAHLYQVYDERRRQGLNFEYAPEAVLLFHEVVGLHQLLFDLIKAPLHRGLAPYKIKQTLSNHLQNLWHRRFYWLFGVKVGLGILLCPLIWTAFALPGATQIAVSMGAVLNLDFNATKQKSLMRVYGCFIGAALAIFTLMVLRVESLSLLLLLIFAVAYGCSHLHNSASRYAYLGTQAIVAYLMGVIVGFAPSWVPDPAVERLVDIIGGVLFLYFILEWLWPFSKQELQAHYQEQLALHFQKIKTLTLAYVQHPDFALMRSLEQPLRLMRRDLAQAKQNGVKPPLYALQLEPLETLLFFVATYGVQLQSQSLWIQEMLDALDQGSLKAFLAKRQQSLQALRRETQQGHFTPLAQIILFGTLWRMVDAFVAEPV